MGAKNHCNQYFAFQSERGEKSQRQIILVSMTTMSWVFGLVLKWHDNSELSPLGGASAKFPDPMKFQSSIVNFRAEVCAKARNERKKGEKLLHRAED